MRTIEKTSRIRIIKGHPSYAEPVSFFAFESGPEYNRELFGRNFHKIITRLYRKGKGYYSFRNSLLAVDDDQLAGILMYTDYPTIRKESFYTDLWIMLYELPYLFVQMRSLVNSDKQIKMIQPGECYIMYLTVLSSLRSQGIGTRLLKELEQMGLGKGYHFISLDVNQENKRGIRFYLDNGFRTIKEFSIRLRSTDFHLIRMRKDLKRGPVT